MRNMGEARAASGGCATLSLGILPPVALNVIAPSPTIKKVPLESKRRVREIILHLTISLALIKEWLRQRVKSSKVVLRLTLWRGWQALEPNSLSAPYLTPNYA